MQKPDGRKAKSPNQRNEVPQGHWVRGLRAVYGKTGDS